MSKLEDAFDFTYMSYTYFTSHASIFIGCDVMSAKYINILHSIIGRTLGIQANATVEILGNKRQHAQSITKSIPSAKKRRIVPKSL